MAASDTGKVLIYNLALQKLGEYPIASLSSTNASAKVTAINAIYEHCVKFVIASAFWGFATKEVELSPVAGEISPVMEYGYRFALPSDFLRMERQFEQTRHTTYRIIGRYIYSNSPTFKFRYVYNNTDISEYPTEFVECLSCYIAYQITPASDKERRGELYSLYRLSRAQALQIDSGNDNYNRDAELTEWDEAFYS